MLDNFLNKALLIEVKRIWLRRYEFELRAWPFGPKLYARPCPYKGRLPRKIDPKQGAGFPLAERRGDLAIAKGPGPQRRAQTFFVEGRKSFRLPPRDPALFLIQRPRDEAIARHRNPPRPAQEGARAKPARRNPRHRPSPSGRSCSPSARPGRRPRRPCRSGKDAGPQRRDGKAGYRLLPRCWRGVRPLF